MRVAVKKIPSGTNAARRVILLLYILLFLDSYIFFAPDLMKEMLP